jgi:predicted MFS family arabinose efflux permease
MLAAVALQKHGVIAWTLVAAAYAVAFFQRFCLPAITPDLSKDFGVHAQGIGVLASAYFCGYLAMQLPAGVLVDALGTRFVIIGSLTASSIGTICFLLSSNILEAFSARLIISCGDAFIFTALIKLVAQQFQDKRFGLFSGLSQLSGYLGGIAATVPLAVLNASFGWRATFTGLAGFTLINLLLSTLILAPSETKGAKLSSVFSTLNNARRELRQKESWGCILAFGSQFVTGTTVSGVWGIPMLVDAYGLPSTFAGTPILLFMAGSIIGTIGFGFLADRCKSTSRVLITIGLARSSLLAALTPIIGINIGLFGITCCFFFFGLIAGGTTPLVLKGVKAIYSVQNIGIGSAINSMFSSLAMAAMQPLFGALLEWAGEEQSLDFGIHYSKYGYNLLMTCVTGFSLLGLIGPILMKDRSG